MPVTYPTARARSKAKLSPPPPPPYRAPSTRADIDDLRALVQAVNAERERLAAIDITTEDLPDTVRGLVRQARRQGETMRARLDEWRQHYRSGSLSIARGRYNEYQAAAQAFFATIQQLVKVDIDRADDWLDILDLAEVDA